MWGNPAATSGGAAAHPTHHMHQRGSECTAQLPPEPVSIVQQRVES